MGLFQKIMDALGLTDNSQSTPMQAENKNTNIPKEEVTNNDPPPHAAPKKEPEPITTPKPELIPEDKKADQQNQNTISGETINRLKQKAMETIPYPNRFAARLDNYQNTNTGGNKLSGLARKLLEQQGSVKKITIEPDYLFHSTSSIVQGDFLEPKPSKTCTQVEGNYVFAGASAVMAFGYALKNKELDNISKVLAFPKVGNIPVLIMNNKELIGNNPEGRIYILPAHGFEKVMREDGVFTGEYVSKEKIAIKDYQVVEGITPEIAMRKGVQIFFVQGKLAEHDAWDKYYSSLNGMLPKQIVASLKEKVKAGELLHYNVEKNINANETFAGEARIKERDYPGYGTINKIESHRIELRYKKEFDTQIQDYTPQQQQIWREMERLLQLEKNLKPPISKMREKALEVERNIVRKEKGREHDLPGGR